MEVKIEKEKVCIGLDCKFCYDEGTGWVRCSLFNIIFDLNKDNFICPLIETKTVVVSLTE